MKVRYLLILLLILNYHNNKAQCPSLGFSIPESVCLGEKFSISNSSTNLADHNWDFCSGSLTGSGEIDATVSISSLNQVFGLDHVYTNDTGHVVFVTSGDNDLLIRIDQGFTLDASYSITELSSLGLTIDFPTGISMWESSGEWYGLVGTVSGVVYRLNFGSDLLSVPTIDSIASFTAPNRGIDISMVDGRVVGFVAGGGNPGKLGILDFGSTISTTPTSVEHDISGSSSLGAISVINECGTLYGLVGGFNSGLRHLRFSDGVMSPPIVQNIGGFSRTRSAALLNDGSVYYGLVLENSTVHRLTFGSSMNNTSPEDTDLGNYGAFGGTNIGFSLLEDSGYYRFTVGGFNDDKVHHLRFTKSCGIDTSKIIAFSPTGISYGTAGTYKISLKARSVSGGLSTLTKEIVVKNEIAPDIDFSIDSSRCLGNSNVFTSTPAIGLTYNWDFNGEGSGSNSEEIFQFSTTGMKAVTLEVSDGLCENKITDTLTIYAAPTVANFNFTTSSLCTNSLFSFENLTNEEGSGAVIGYTWDFNGEGGSNAKSPTFSFTSPGFKTIALEAYIPGCTTNIYSEQIEIKEGPEPGFSYTGNCSIGSSIQFFNTSTGDSLVGYNWDFGDGSTTSTLRNPQIRYDSGGRYRVVSSVTDSEGCTSEVSDSIYVSNSARIGFSFTNGQQGQPIEFIGNDLSPSDDSVISWTWNFAGLGTSTEQSPSFIFTDVGSYSVHLEVETVQGCKEDTLRSVEVSAAQCPSLGFSIPESVCLGEKFSISNSSTNLADHNWDFCSGSLTGSGEIDATVSISSLNQVFGLDHVYTNDTGHVVFVTSGDNDLLIRIDQGFTLDASYSITELSSLGLTIDFPTGISMWESSGEWYGLVGTVSGVVYRLNFGSDLLSVPTIDSIASFTAPNRGIDISMVDGRVVGFVAGGGNPGKLGILDFGSTISTTPTSVEHDISGSSSLGAISVINECGTLYGLVGGFNSGLRHLRFSDGVMSPPIVQNIGGFSRTRSAALLNDGSVYYGLVLENSTVHRLTFGSSMNNTSPEDTDLGNYGAFGGTNIGFSLLEDSGYYRFTVGGFNDDKVHHLRFTKSCGIDTSKIIAFSPTGISYGTAGTYKISLKARSVSGGLSTLTKEIVVKNEVSPTINFTTNTLCTTPEALLESTASGPISTYTWSLPANQTSTSPNPTITFDTAGTYPIRLDVVGDNGCTNFVEQEITIYDPPQASFDITNTLFCEDDSIFFENNSLFDGPDSLVSYQWDFAGQSVAVSGNTGFVFDTPGTKAVQLSASIPGCSTDTIQTFEINASPNPSFDFSDLCIDQITRFENTTNDTDIDNYLWEFGDGGEATQIAPNYQYSAPGDYVVRLTAVNEAGCDNFIERNIAIRALPQVGFEAEIGCAGQALQLIDTSIVDGANITQWQWDFAGQGTSEQPSPQFTFAEAGEYEITLTTTSNFGCSNTATQVVEVRKAPVPDFSIEQGCFGEPVRLEDITITDQETRILDYFWQIEDNTFRNEAVSYIFDEPGDYEISLTLDYLNLCSNTVTKTITILPPINADFENTQACDNNITFFTDLSTVQEDSIVSRTWDFAGLGAANGREAQFEFPGAGAYDITLSVLSARGCTEQVTKTVVVDPAPVASFIPSSTFGPPPFNVFFENTSSADARQFIWSVDGEVISSDSEDFEFTFNEIAIYDVTLTVIDSLGCQDSNTQSIRVDIPAYDLAIQEIQGANTADATNIVLRISNLATVDVEGIDLVIALENGIKLLEPLDAFIRYKSSIIYTLDTRLPADTPLESICINLPLEYQGLTDPTPINNEACINLIQSLVVGQPYPNPGDGKFRLDVVLPEDDNLDLELLNMQGQQVLFESYPNLKAGLQPLLLDYSNNRPGMYFLRIYTSDGVATRRVIIGF